MKNSIFLTKRSWQKKIKKLDIYNDIKDGLLDIFDFNIDKFLFYKIKNSKIVESFINIKSYKNLFIVFDIEFQSATINEDEKKNNKFIYSFNSFNEPYSSFPRELGAMIFVRDRNKDIYYLGTIFRNFQPLINHGFGIEEMRYMMAKYATVSKKTLKRMEKNDVKFTLDLEIMSLLENDYESLLTHNLFKSESEINRKKVKENIKTFFKTTNESEKKDIIKKIKWLLRRIPFNAFKKYLNRSYANIFENQFELYYDDPLVKKRLLSKKDQRKLLKSLIDISDITCFIIKGTRDLDALKNFTNLLNIKKRTFSFDHLYDIEIFNGFSKIKYGNAQLETTYEGLIRSNVYKEVKKELELIKKTVVGTAHNPLVDSYFTIVVAIILNIGINKFFPSEKIYQSQKGGFLKNKNYTNIKISSDFKKKYRYIKNRYNILKNRIIKNLF